MHALARVGLNRGGSIKFGVSPLGRFVLEKWRENSEPFSKARWSLNFCDCFFVWTLSGQGFGFVPLWTLQRLNATRVANNFEFYSDGLGMFGDHFAKMRRLRKFGDQVILASAHRRHSKT